MEFLCVIGCCANEDVIEAFAQMHGCGTFSLFGLWFVD
jgi:hypothetical protein